MNQRTFSALWLSFGLGLAFSGESCVTCPAGQQSCGNSNPGADAGASGDSETSCAFLSKMQSCMDSYCKTASNPFCTCWKRGFDLTTNGCTCVDLDTKKICDRADAEGLDADSYDCAAASSGVSSYCVTVN
ncbi:MAG TPA: hypothetical protein VFK05_02055 [Polyangiaceae bacterium]|nr:hypothetical protein [Polyangiaceae bacterium]